MEHPAGGRGGTGLSGAMSESNARLEIEPHRASSDARLLRRYSIPLAGVLHDLGCLVEANEAAGLFIPERKP